MNRRGLTLVEMLVVIGIIVVLMALLMPALNRVRQMNAQTVCTSNMRNIGQALLLYAADNNNYFPKCATINGSAKFDPGDWIDWRPAPANVLPLQRSAVGRYMGQPQPKDFRCPSDVLEQHLRVLESGHPYLYSYTLNNYLASDTFNAKGTVPLQRVKNAAQMILLADEDESSADDGNYLPDYTPAPNRIAVRHELGRRTAGDKSTITGDSDYQRRGNVLLADGHVDFVTRAWTNVVVHYDPTLQP